MIGENDYIDARRAATAKFRHQFLAGAGGKRLIVINALFQEQPAVLSLINPILVRSRPASFGDEVVGERLAIEQVLELPARQIGTNDAKEHYVRSQPRQGQSDVGRPADAFLG